MDISLPDFCLVLLFGSSTVAVDAFARRHFAADEMALPGAIRAPLANRKTAVVDASDRTRDGLAALAHIARETHTQIFVVLLGQGADRHAHGLGQIAVKATFDVADGADVQIARTRVSTDHRDIVGPFDIIGDIHGCVDELVELLGRLGYGVRLDGLGTERRAMVSAPAGRRAVFVGDLVDRGPNAPDVLRVVMALVGSGQGIAVAGNHDVKFLRWLDGRNVQLTHGLDLTVAQLATESDGFRQEVRAFLNGLTGHVWLDGGRLAVAHAGVREEMIGRASGSIREFTLFGDTSGKPGLDGLPVRYHWALDYRGQVTVVYGHTPVADAAWVGNTVCLDTGCCFGGRLSALRWPEREFVTVVAKTVYAPLRRAFGHGPPRPET